MVNMFGKPNAKMVKDIRKKLIPVKRESVCELMPPNNFYDAIKAVIPSVTQDQVRLLSYLSLEYIAMSTLLCMQFVGYLYLNQSDPT